MRWKAENLKLFTVEQQSAESSTPTPPAPPASVGKK